MARKKSEKSKLPSVKITLTVNDVEERRLGFEVNEIDLGESRTRLAMGIGGAIIDAVWSETEGARKRR